MSDAFLVRRLMIGAVVVAMAAAVWVLSDILLLLFGAVLVSIVLRAIADPISGRTGLPEGLAILLAVLALVVLPVAAVWLLGDQLLAQLGYLERTLPEALGRALEQARLRDVTSSLDGSTIGTLLAQMLSFSAAVIGAVASTVLVIAGAIYLAADPESYRQGLLRLVPQPERTKVDAVLREAGQLLHRWLGAQLLAMLCVGLATGLGMWMAGVPSPLALGLIAGLTEFVPYVGPISGAVPALLLAYGEGTGTMLGALAVLVVVQQFENYVIMPLAVGRATPLLPVAAIFAVISFGVLLGPLGLLFGYPLTLTLAAVIKVCTRDGERSSDPPQLITNRR